MADNPDISELLDSYGDGTLSAEEAQRLLARLEQSEELREQLAGVAVAQRLLTAVHAEPVAYERVRRALRARGLMPEQPEAAPQQPVKAPAGRRLAMAPASWNQAKTSAPSSPWLVVGISLTLGLLVAAGVLPNMPRSMRLPLGWGSSEKSDAGSPASMHCDKGNSR